MTSPSPMILPKIILPKSLSIIFTRRRRAAKSLSPSPPSLPLHALHGKNSPSLSPAFTTIELLCVMAIAMILLGIALASSMDWGRGIGMRTSSTNTRSSLDTARQWAITHRISTDWICTNDYPEERGYAVILPGGTERLGNTNYLSKGIIFDTNSIGKITFTPDGSCDNAANNINIVLLENERRDLGIHTTITVYRTTGYTSIRE